MVEQKEIYRCNVCENVVEVQSAGEGTLVCCNQDMILLIENVNDDSIEIHIPIIKIDNEKIMVIVGDEEHPMEEKHHIEWIQIVTIQKTFTKYLNQMDRPSTSFIVPLKENIIKVRAYCNLHGLWVKEINE